MVSVGHEDSSKGAGGAMVKSSLGTGLLSKLSCNSLPLPPSDEFPEEETAGTSNDCEAEDPARTSSFDLASTLFGLVPVAL